MPRPARRRIVFPSSSTPATPEPPMPTSDDLVDAVLDGDVAAVRRLLDADPKLLTAPAEGGMTPVLAAAYRQREEILRLLLDWKPRLNVFEAAAAGETEQLRDLLDAEPGLVTRVSTDGWTALHLAAFFGHAGAVRLLLERGSEVDARSLNTMRNTPLHAGVAGPLGADGVRLLLDHGADPDARQEGGLTALHAAAQRGDTETVRLLLERGARPGLPDDEGRVPADLARAAGHDGVAQTLSAG